MKKPLWTPSETRKQQSNMSQFMQYVNESCGLDCSTYKDLYEWSITDIPAFWAAMWDFGEMQSSRAYDQVVDQLDEMMTTKWFAGARLNFAQNLLRFRNDKTALVFKSEAKPELQRMSYAELYRAVAGLAAALKRLGVDVGDRVVGYMPNMMETVVAMLATTSLGAVWSSCSPDFGIKGALDRFGQIQPKVVFTTDGYFYNGKVFNSLPKVQDIVAEIPSVEQIVVVPYVQSVPELSQFPAAVLYPDFMEKAEEINFVQLPFDHPVYIMYSSGTTGVPKCIVHGAGGTLLQHLKELKLHTDLRAEDVIFYYTTCGWMMWNWLVSSLALGVTVVLFDGSPFYPDAGALWQLAADQGITVFGTSAKYLEAIEKAGVQPGTQYNLSKLKTLLSTGSPLSTGSFQFVYREIKQDLCLASISGGTDIISCFALGNPLQQVYAGELQCRGLGMKVESYDSQGHPVIGAKGDLVCTAPFPSRPIYFWKDFGNEKYFQSYFATYPQVWRHGDYVEITPAGGVIIYGRSDTTLNPGGVRIGTAEIYRQVEAVPEVLDSLVVGQEWQGDVRVILFVKMAAGHGLQEELKQKIRQTIRANATPRHVPAKIIAVPDIPYTINGKKVELAVRNVIHGQTVVNQESLANPEVLRYFQHLEELKED